MSYMHHNANWACSCATICSMIGPDPVPGVLVLYLHNYSTTSWGLPERRRKPQTRFWCDWGMLPASRQERVLAMVALPRDRENKTNAVHGHPPVITALVTYSWMPQPLSFQVPQPTPQPQPPRQFCNRFFIAEKRRNVLAIGRARNTTYYVTRVV